MRILLLSIIVLEFLGCKNASDPAAAGSSTQTETTQAPAAQSTAERDRIQKPEEIIALMGNNLTGMTIADLFADDGYITFKLLNAGANVIAIVNDAEKAKAIEARKKAMGLGDDRLKVRTVPVGDPGLAKEEVDMAVIFHSFVGIANKNDYFTRMREGMRYPRPLMMVEWRYDNTPTGPPLSERMKEEAVMDFISTTGYSDVGAHSAKIPDQVIYMINDYMEMEGDPMAPPTGP